jgi:hypothetical protein
MVVVEVAIADPALFFALLGLGLFLREIKYTISGELISVVASLSFSSNRVIISRSSSSPS